MIEQLKQYGELHQNMRMSQLTTLKIGGPVKAVFYPFDIIGLIAGLKFLNTHQIKYKTIGHGSNILASDDVYDGVIIKLNRTLNSSYFLDEEVFVEAGASLVLLSDLAMKQSLTGLEWAAGIPATVGGALYMNAGAYRHSMSEFVDKVLVLQGNELVWLSNKECEFDYRTSVFQKNPNWIILGVNIKLKKGDDQEIKEVMARRKQQRLSTQPLNKASSGSTFRNPNDKSSWELIDGCGLRGFSIGGAQVSKKHANFLINTGHATCQDMIKLIQLIQQSVKEKYQVQLQLEVEQFNWNNNDQ